MAGAKQFGGVTALSDERHIAIEEWYAPIRLRSAQKRSAGRAASKVALVTGAAQGFGLEIARHLASDGACVALADINADGAAAAAADITTDKGAGRAIGIAMNVCDGQSVADAVHQAIRAYGGLDLLVSNAGVLKAESVKTQSEKDFDFVTAVNYKGYFLCVQKVSPVLALQRRGNSEYWSDIVQINSKSGLAGSNRNFAYAGSKFGGVGLTQSFAMELVTDGVKVNSICPGNFLDGPLWSDPEKGLFVQYLRARKIPGAKTVEDVRHAYEKMVPMARGCSTADVMKAIYYVMEQKYETGQAIPVTGGQIMLR
jgi:NAD(P)-dependent dehydrogenase (short-subunit alcohol dehydrogenase family)